MIASMISSTVMGCSIVAACVGFSVSVIVSRSVLVALLSSVSWGAALKMELQKARSDCSISRGTLVKPVAVSISWMFVGR